MFTSLHDRADAARVAPLVICTVALLLAAGGCKTHSMTPASGASPSLLDLSKPAAPSPKPAVAVPAVTAPAAAEPPSSVSPKSLVLQEGDTIKIDFPGAPAENTTQIIRRDGKITLDMIGEYDAAGKTPATVQAELKKLYASQIVNSENSVTVQSSAFIVRVMGAVSRPGKVVSDRPLNVLEALIEAGIDNSKSNLKAIQILRTDASGHTEKFTLNLYKFLHSKNGQMPSFTLKPYDVINVPERFSFIQ